MKEKNQPPTFTPEFSTTRAAEHQQASSKKEEVLVVYTIYKHPTDYPDHYVLKRWLCGKQIVQDETYLFAHPELEACRDQLYRKVLFNVGRVPGDDPCILESWV